MLKNVGFRKEGEDHDRQNVKFVLVVTVNFDLVLSFRGMRRASGERER